MLVEVGRLESALHRKTGAESSLDGSGRPATARGIEAFCVRVTDDVQDARGALHGDIGAMFDQQSPNASFPECRLDEQPVELGIPVRPRQDCCETDDYAVALRHEHVTIRNCSAGSAIAFGFASSESRSPGLASEARHCSASRLDRSA